MTFGLLLCSAALFFIGYVRWDISWVANIASTVIIASVTTVIIDRLIVRYRRARLTRVIESVRRRLEDSCDDLVGAVTYIREQMDRAYPKPPYWIAGGGYTSAGVEDSWRFSLEELNDAANAWTVLVGYSFRSVQINAISDSLTNLRDAHTEALDVFARLAAHMKSKETPFRGLFGEPAPQPDKKILKAAETVASKVTNMAHEAVAAIEQLKTCAGEDDLPARVTRRHPFRLPRWLQFATVLMAISWVVVLTCAQLVSTAFPHGFVKDSMLNIASNVAIALFAGALTIALVEARRIIIAKNTFPSFYVLSSICASIAAKTTPSGQLDLRRIMTEQADLIADLTYAIQNESPSPELAFWTRIVTDAMHRLAAVETPFFISEADAADEFANILRPTGHPVLDADKQAVIARRKAGASTQPSAPIHQLVNLLQDLYQLTEAAHAAAQGQGA